MAEVIAINQLSKVYDNGFEALNNASLSINEGEIFALLGPNGAGKTTLISLICGLLKISSGTVTVAGFDNQLDFRQARQLIGLVPQELTTDMFISVYDAVSFSRGLFGLKANPEKIESILKSLSLWDKKDSKIMTLSGGMKRRVMIAKALSHEPQILFLDEPTAGVDVELRKSMWAHIHALRKSGVTIILTTHYIEEAEEMADRIGIINKGQLTVVEKKETLIQKLGKKQLIVTLSSPLKSLPDALHTFDLQHEQDTLTYNYNFRTENTRVSELIATLNKEGIQYSDLMTRKSSLEEIFVELLNKS